MCNEKNTIKKFVILVASFFLLVWSTACSPVQNAQQDAADVVAGIDTIGVLPVQVLIGDEDAAGSPGLQTKKAALQQGARVAESILRKELNANKKVHFIREAELLARKDVLVQGGGRAIVSLGQHLGLDAVLVGVVERYWQREGNEYAATVPASVSFTLRLYDARNGAILWSTRIDETQEALLDNLFSFGKAQRRGFRWVRAEELLAHEIQERLAQQPYL